MPSVRIEVFGSFNETLRALKIRDFICSQIQLVAKDTCIPLEEISVTFINSVEFPLNEIVKSRIDSPPSDSKIVHVKIFGPKGVPHHVSRLARQLAKSVYIDRVECYYPEYYEYKQEN